MKIYRLSGFVPGLPAKLRWIVLVMILVIVSGLSPLAVQAETVPANEAGGTKTISVEAYIDGRSQLIIRDNMAQWHHFDFAAPGRHFDFPSHLPTIINGVEWYPVWADNPTPENRCRDCFSDVFEGVVPPLPRADSLFILTNKDGRGEISIVELPSSSNDYALVIEFNDNPQSGPADYSVVIEELVSVPSGLSMGLVGYWKFDDPGDLGLDSSGFENRGTITPGDVTYSEDGIANGAAKLVEGTTNAAIQVSHSDSLNLTEEVTMAAWVKLDGNDGDNGDAIFAKDGATQPYAFFGVLEDVFGGAMGAWYSGTPLNSDSAIPDSRWAHLATTYDGATARFYVDGRLTSEKSSSVGLREDPTADLYIGASPYGIPEDFSGLMDEARASIIVCSPRRKSSSWVISSPTLRSRPVHHPGPSSPTVRATSPPCLIPTSAAGAARCT